MSYNQYTVNSFDEYIKCITEIGQMNSIDSNTPPVLWSRGHRMHNWNLLPTLTRSVKLGSMGGKLAGSSYRAIEEELRQQHYVAKNFHFLPREPQSSLEWMEVMQHHGVKTRLLDWSESMIHSLIFALECFFNEKEYRTAERIQSSPCVWIIQPVDWNREALKLLFKNINLIEECIDSVPSIFTHIKSEIKLRMQQLQGNIEDYFSEKNIMAHHLNKIFNLSSIAGELQSMRSDDLVYQMRKGELYYCIFYFLMFVYMNTRPVKITDVLPLSIVESYHSDRIRAQKGAFSIFPYYEETPQIQSLKRLQMYPDSMENMSLGNKYLHKILLNNPDKIAFEVMNAGLNISWLYPEMPVVANAIENRKIII